ncbi:MAG: HDOD domain-containing protein [Thermodesulfobacteriota bacterium]|nr:HDOD domain-containing protein [Thermodesulfobacteriota bacterium]
MKTDSGSNLLKSIASGYSLPPLSVAAIKLIELASDDTSSANDLARVIDKDPALAARLLKLANNAFFRSISPVSTLKQAIVRIGFHQLRIMALSLSLRETFPMGKEGGMDYEKFWRSSLYRALLAKSLAQHLKCCNPEEAFAAGLIHEIGIIILFDLLIKGKGDDFAIDSAPFERTLAQERARYGIDHRQAGEAALRFWKFPDEMITCQSLYGNEALLEDVPPLARVCEMARRLSQTLFQHSKGLDPVFLEADGTFGIEQDVVNDALSTTFQEVQAIAEDLRVELNRERDLLGILEKANQTLSRISEKLAAAQVVEKKKQLPSLDSLTAECDPVVQTLQAVAHEIRNPLLAVGGFARKLSEVLDPSSDGGKYATIILTEATRLECAFSEMIQKVCIVKG